MSTAAPTPPLFRTRNAVPVRRSVPPLENGDRLTSAEFLRRYEATPELKKAELIEGTVYMPPPVSISSHAIPDGIIQIWLGCYALEHPHLELVPNGTYLLDTGNTPQPDAILCTIPRPGGRVWLNSKDYLCGAPELVCEVAATSASIDLHQKFAAYERAGVQEYLVWLTVEKRVRWFELKDGKFVQKKERAGKLSSTVFPGLILDVKALLKHDRRRVVAALK